MTQTIINKIITYLESMKVVVNENSDMEDIILQRDYHYGEDDQIQECINALHQWIIEQ